jgi:hypothetical protein
MDERLPWFELLPWIYAGTLSSDFAAYSKKI